MTEGMVRFVEELDSTIFFDMRPKGMRDLETQNMLTKKMIDSMGPEGKTVRIDISTGEQQVITKVGLQEELRKNEAREKEYFDRFIESTRLGQIDIVEDRFQQALLAQQAEIAANTASTADHTDPNKLKDQVPFMLDASITSLSDALLSISRRAVEEPDPIQEGLLSVNASQLDALENLSRGGIGRRL